MDGQTITSTLDLALFTGAPQHERFSRLADLLPVRKMAPSSAPMPFPHGEQAQLPQTYDMDGSARSVHSFLIDTDTAALIVLKNGAVRSEYYALTGGRDTHWISFSVAKSFVSTLVGIALGEGAIGSVDEPISDYIDVTPGSAYDGVAIRHVLQMSSGARWNEDYADPNSDIFRLGAVMGGASTLDAFVADMVRENEPGTVCRYNSADTQALGALVARATKCSLADYMQEKLAEPLGFTAPGYWLIDSAGTEMAFAGVNLIPLDFARLGELFRNRGIWQGQQVIPAEWVEASLTASAAHLQPGRVILNDHTLPIGYGYQWWLPDGDHGEFAAMGVYNQYVYVDPSRDTVVVKLSANRNYGTTSGESTNRDMESIEFLRAIAVHCG
ncbi:serine hydrolase [Mycobacterium sp. CBMA271]|uniref:serine hydrolase domain-containing protein n=1 Tax=unclassified Mycobacteroides TaxID=2618759 RepID=UPI0012DE37E8|nr:MULTISPECIES: serine hydrolase [unclassified Mycobacteroides]MUM17855.1 serine hydrolase [Mycobacteroides sp. CBMA 326]MUM20426.1 serine hydrolase [Mycobacteroides sp. CBMA 271]